MCTHHCPGVSHKPRRRPRTSNATRGDNQGFPPFVFLPARDGRVRTLLVWMLVAGILRARMCAGGDGVLGNQIQRLSRPRRPRGNTGTHKGRSYACIAVTKDFLLAVHFSRCHELARTRVQCQETGEYREFTAVYVPTRPAYQFLFAVAAEADNC